MAESWEMMAVTAFKDIQTRRIQYQLHESSYNVPGKVTELEWKDYCPNVFRLCLLSFYIDPC